MLTQDEPYPCLFRSADAFNLIFSYPQCGLGKVRMRPLQLPFRGIDDGERQLLSGFLFHQF